MTTKVEGNKMRSVLCSDCSNCPVVEQIGNEISIGEDDNIATLSIEEWNILVDDIKSGKLHKL